MKILVTGGAGFIGSHLCKYLVDRGNDVFSYDLKDGADITNFDQLSSYFKSFNFNQVFALAAQAYMKAGEENPELDVRVNYLGTLNILKLLGNRRMVYTSSGAVLGACPDVPSREDSLCSPLSNYGVTKLAAENLCMKYALANGANVSITRFSSVYGPRRTEGPINLFLRASLEGKPITVFGSGEHTRDYVFIDDVIEGLILVMEQGKLGQIYNIASGEEHSVNEIAEIINGLTGAKIVHVPDKMGRFDIPRNYFSIKRARALGYRSKITLKKGIERTLEAERCKEKTK